MMSDYTDEEITKKADELINAHGENSVYALLTTPIGYALKHMLKDRTTTLRERNAAYNFGAATQEFIEAIKAGGKI